MNELNDTVSIEDGCPSHPPAIEALPVVNLEKQIDSEKNVKKKRRRGKSKRKVMKPYVKMSWRQRKKNNDKMSKMNRSRNLLNLQTKTHAPYNNNQFLMEIHKPEPGVTPSARTRDSSFSVDSEDNYFFSLPEDEEEFLTKEFSSVYEAAQCERLATMSKIELVQEYLLLESKYESVTKRALKGRNIGPDIADSESPTHEELAVKLQQQEEEIRELKSINDKLRQQNERLRRTSSSADSESDSSTSSDSSSSSSQGSFELETVAPAPLLNGYPEEQPLVNGYGEEPALMNGSVNGDCMDLHERDADDMSDTEEGSRSVVNGHGNE